MRDTPDSHATAARGRTAKAVAASARDAGQPALPEWIGLKWLMGLRGHRLDAQRLQTDRDYASQCLALACAGDDGLRRYAEGLRARLHDD